MSGVEAAGLVLGALPILISSLERFRRLGAKSRKGQRDYQLLRHELVLNLVLFRNTIRVLFADSLESNQLDELLSNPTSSQWQSPDVEAALKGGLGPAYPAFVDLAVKIFETVSSIESAFRKIACRPKPTIIVNTAFSADKPSHHSQEIQDLASRIKLLAQSTVSLRQLQAIENLGALLVRFHEFQEVAQGAERRAANNVRFERRANTESNFDRPSASFEESEYDDDELGESWSDSDTCSLSFLSISLEAADSPKRRVQEDALLDTGATNCAISLSTAVHLGLDIQEHEHAGIVTIRTAALNQTLSAQGRARLTLRWRDESRTRHKIEMWVLVVPLLNHAVLLSHAFTKDHPGVWNVAREFTYTIEEFNFTWLSGIRKKQPDAEDAFRRKQEEENQRKADAAKDQRLAELDKIIADPTQAPQPASTAPSIAGSSVSNTPPTTTAASSSSTAATSGAPP